MCKFKEDGGLWILGLKSHVIARLPKLLIIMFEQRQPWTLMHKEIASYMNVKCCGQWHGLSWIDKVFSHAFLLFVEVLPFTRHLIKGRKGTIWQM